MIEVLSFRWAPFNPVTGWFDGDTVASWDLTGDQAETMTGFSEATEYGTAGPARPKGAGD